MAQQEIRINIAGRYYAMYITPEQEEDDKGNGE